MIFSKSNPPPGYYVYLYLREDGTPYYCGKGKGRRAWAKDHTVSPPVDQSRIVFPAYNLLELWAFGLERKFIKWYGRIDLGTGILRNQTDGGDGFPNRIVSPTTVAKALATKRATGGVYVCATPEARRKRKETLLEKNNGQYHSDDAINNIITKSAATKKKTGKNSFSTWQLTSPSGEEFITTQLTEFITAHSLNLSQLKNYLGTTVPYNLKLRTLPPTTLGWKLVKLSERVYRKPKKSKV